MIPASIAGVTPLAVLVEGPVVVARHAGRRDERHRAFAQWLRERREGDHAGLLPRREVEEAVRVDGHQVKRIVQTNCNVYDRGSAPGGGSASDMGDYVSESLFPTGCGLILLAEKLRSHGETLSPQMTTFFELLNQAYNHSIMPPETFRPLFVVEFADMTGEGWGKTAAVLLRYFLEMRKLSDLIGVENSGTRLAALDDFDAGMGDLKPGELRYALMHGCALSEILSETEKFLAHEDVVQAGDFVDLPELLQLEFLNPRQTPLKTSPPLRIREIARKCVRKLRERERELQKNSRGWLARDLDGKILAIANAANQEPRQTETAPGRRLILTMTESDLTAIYSIGENCSSIYDLKGRVIEREGLHRLRSHTYEGLVGLLDPRIKNEPVVVARLLYFVEGQTERFKNPWEINPEEHLPYSRQIQELVRKIADGLQIGLRNEKVMKILSSGMLRKRSLHGGF